MKIAVIGGGIGGLTAALAMYKAGLDVEVYEQTAQWRTVGAGLRITPNATRVLIRLGLAEPLAKIGIKTKALMFRRWKDGSELATHQLGEAMEQAFASPYYHVHRADLIGILAAALPQDRIHLAHKCVGFSQNADHAAVEFQNGVTVKADLVIAADGVHSVIRNAIHGAEKPRFSGDISFRGLVPIDRLPEIVDAKMQNLWIGPNRHFVQTFAGSKYVNFIALVPGPEGRESWSDRGEMSEVIDAFDGWDPMVHRIIKATDEVWRYPLYDRDPLDQWSVGRATLLGDAAHPMLPYMAQGAVQSIEDCALIARVLVEPNMSLQEKLATYENMRKPRTSRIQGGSREFGKLYHLEDGPAQQKRDASFNDAIAGSGLDRGDWLFGYDIIEDYERRAMPVIA